MYPFAGSMIVIGCGAFLYGIQSEDVLLVVEGAFLVWFGIRITFAVLEGQSIEARASREIS
jgi:hypothetical protein